MRFIIILITAIIIDTTTCNAQGWQGFARRAAKAATTTPKVLNKYRTPIITGIAVGSMGLSNQRDRQLHTPNATFHHPYLQTMGVPVSMAVARAELARASHSSAAALSTDSLNLYVMVQPTDTTHVQMQDILTIK